MSRDRPPRCPTNWGCATFASWSTTSRRWSTAWQRTATVSSAASVSTRTCGAWRTCAGRRESSWPWPSGSTDPAPRSRRQAPLPVTDETRLVDRRVSFWLVAIVLVLLLFAASAPSPLYGVYQRLWNFSPLTLTAIYASYALGGLLTLLITGRL